MLSPQVFINKSFDLFIELNKDKCSNNIIGITNNVNSPHATAKIPVATWVPILIPVDLFLPLLFNALNAVLTIKEVKAQVNKGNNFFKVNVLGSLNLNLFISASKETFNKDEQVTLTSQTISRTKSSPNLVNNELTSNKAFENTRNLNLNIYLYLYYKKRI